MKIKPYLNSKQCGLPVKRSGRFLKCIRHPALILSIVSLTIAFGTGCSSNGGFNAHLTAPATSNRRTMGPADDGWYHPPESPGVAPFGDA
jgi:hypothetical protein